MALLIDGAVPLDMLPKLGNIFNVQVNQAGYKSPAHELAAFNERDMTQNAELMSKARRTAFLLRELYAGNIVAAQQKIIADSREDPNGELPYIAPGIDALVGLDKFDRQRLRFKSGAGVPEWLLRRTVREWGFPRNVELRERD